MEVSGVLVVSPPVFFGILGIWFLLVLVSVARSSRTRQNRAAYIRARDKAVAGEAREAFDALLRVESGNMASDPSAPARAQALSLLQGWCQEKLGDAAGARKTYEAAMGEGPLETAMFQALLRVTAEREGSQASDEASGLYAKAGDLYEEAYRHGVREDWLVQRYAVRLSALDRRDQEAAEVFRLAWATGWRGVSASDAAHMALVLAADEMRSRRYEMAFAYLDAARAVCPSKEVLFGLATVCLALGRDVETDQVVAEAAARFDDGRLELLRDVLRCTGKDAGGRPPRMAALLAAAATCKSPGPRTPPVALTERGQLLALTVALSTGENVEELGVDMDAARQRAVTGETAYVIGETEMKAGRLREAAEAFAQVPRSSTQFRSACYLLGHVLFELGQFAEALEAWGQCDGIEGRLLTLCRIGRLWQAVARGDYKAALQEFATLENEGDSSWDFPAISEPLVGVLLLLGKGAGLMGPVKRAWLMDPQNRACRWARAKSRAAAGQLAAARGEVLLLNAEQSEPELLLNLAILSHALEDMGGASQFARAYQGHLRQGDPYARRASMLAGYAGAASTEDPAELVRRIPGRDEALSAFIAVQVRTTWMTCVRHAVSGDIPFARRGAELLLEKMSSLEEAGDPALRSETVNLIAYCHLKEGRADEAVSLLNNEMKQPHPLDALAYNAATVCIHAGKYEAYKAGWSGLLSRWARSGGIERAVEGYLMLLDVLQIGEGTDWGTVLSIADWALRLRRSLLEALMARRTALWMLDRIDEASKASIKVMHADPDNPAHINIHAWILLRLNRGNLEPVELWFRGENVPEDIRSAFRQEVLRQMMHG